jgi:acetyl-CoA carboxylase biotin carboxyl carrier protein
LELKDIKELISLIRRNDLAEFSLEQEGFKITLKRGAEPQTYVQTAQQPNMLQYPAYLPPQALANPAPATGAPSVVETDSSREINSPMVGTFYSAASPEAPPFVSVGQQITTDTVICIIEAMKVMNEIKAETAGVVVEVLAENGKPVQYGQPLFRLR